MMVVAVLITLAAFIFFVWLCTTEEGNMVGTLLVLCVAACIALVFVYVVAKEVVYPLIT